MINNNTTKNTWKIRNYVRYWRNRFAIHFRKKNKNKYFDVMATSWFTILRRRNTQLMKYFQLFPTVFVYFCSKNDMNFWAFFTSCQNWIIFFGAPEKCLIEQKINLLKSTIKWQFCIKFCRPNGMDFHNLPFWMASDGLGLTVQLMKLCSQQGTSSIESCVAHYETVGTIQRLIDLLPMSFHAVDFDAKLRLL